MDTIREQIAKIIGKELPWREEDLEDDNFTSAIQEIKRRING